MAPKALRPHAEGDDRNTRKRRTWAAGKVLKASLKGVELEVKKKELNSALKAMQRQKREAQRAIRRLKQRAARVSMEDLAEIVMFRAAMVGPQSLAASSSSVSSSGFWQPKDLKEALQCIGEYCEKNLIKTSLPSTESELGSGSADDAESAT